MDNQLPATGVKTEYHLHIEPEHGNVALRFRELIEYRELLFFLMMRDIRVRYKQTILGALWAILQPFMTMIVFSLFFGGLAGIPSDDLPYPIFSYSALVPWSFFATSMAMSSISLVQNGNLLKKVYFPRLTLPIATTLAGVIDFFLAFLVLIGMMIFFGIVPTVNIIWLPVFLLLAFITSLGVGLWLSAMNVQFRDVRYTIPFITQLWLFLTPIAYPTSIIQNDALRAIYSLNPMVGVVEGFRWALLGTDTRPDITIVASAAASIILLLTGLIYFRRMEKTFADVI